MRGARTGVRFAALGGGALGRDAAVVNPPAWNRIPVSTLQPGRTDLASPIERLDVVPADRRALTNTDEPAISEPPSLTFRFYRPKGAVADCSHFPPRRVKQ